MPFEMKKQMHYYGLFISKILTLKTVYEWGWLAESPKIAIVCILIWRWDGEGAFESEEVSLLQC